jgi:hypothetical protein
VTVKTVTTYKFDDGASKSLTETQDHRRGGVPRSDGTRPGHTAIVNGKVDDKGAVPILEQHVRGSERVQSSLLNTSDVPPVVTQTIGKARNPGTNKLEKVTITKTVTISVRGSIWAYKPKAK